MKVCKKTWSGHPEITSVCPPFEKDSISQETVTHTCIVPEQEPREPLAAFVVTEAENSISKGQLQYPICCNCLVKRGILGPLLLL